jgi:hypothetical protein
VNEQPMLEAELARTITLIAVPIIIITVVGFFLFIRWSRREALSRARDIELEEARRNRS